MADIKFGKYSAVFYGDVEKADRPRSSGLTLVPINRYSGRPLPDTEVELYGNNPKDVVERLYLNGRLANGLINNKLYENGVEVSKEQAQAAPVQNYIDIQGELATLGIRTPVGTRGAEFVRDAAAEKKFAEQVRKDAKQAAELGLSAGQFTSQVGVRYTMDKEYYTYLSQASDDEIIARVGGVNKEGFTGAGFGINALINPAELGYTGGGTGVGEYAGTGPGQYIRGSKAITEPDILELAKAVLNAPKDQQAGANARRQLISIFENDPSWLRREQARDAMFSGTTGYYGGEPEFRHATGKGGIPITNAGRIQAGLPPIEGLPLGPLGPTQNPDVVRAAMMKAGLPFTMPTSSTEGDSGGFGTIQNANMTGTGTFNSPLRLNNTPYTGEYRGITYVNGVSTIESAARANRQSAYDELLAEFNKYGLGSLVTDIKGLIERDIPREQFIIELRNTKAYQERFKANAERLKKGLSALNESDYIKNEDAYRNTLRLYGLTEFDNDEYVSQFIANDIRPEELGERVSLAVNKVKMADPAITQTLKQYYGLQDADMVAAILDPKTQLPRIQRQIAASEIGVAAGRQGFNIGPAIAEQLAAQGVTQAGAQEGYGKIAEILPTAEKLSDIYGKELDRYGLAEAEQETFNQLASAQRKRKRLAEREIAAFSGQSGLGRTSLTQAQGGQF